MNSDKNLYDKQIELYVKQMFHLRLKPLSLQKSVFVVTSQ